MKELLEASQSERKRYFQEASARSENIKNPIIMEKDFWVCWTLNQIFSNKELSPHITFKGGTSLSKCYGIINRFSEDIDLTLEKQYIGINSDNDPITSSTISQRNKRLEQLTSKVVNKITQDVLPLLTEIFKKSISAYFKHTEWQLKSDIEDPQTLIFHYPSCVEKKANEYIETAIRLEFGARGDNSPCEPRTISPYILQLLPELFNTPAEFKVISLTAKRTFWEKITLLHAEYHRDPKKLLPRRLFRHYYDVVMLDKKQITQEALQDITLLEDVVKNKTTYFPSKWAHYNEAKIGRLHLYPNEYFMELLNQDHKRMTEMFFGGVPDFDDILSEIKRIESVINNK